MRKAFARFRRLILLEDGPTAVEYAVMLALIVVVCLAAIKTVGTNAKTTFTNVAGVNVPGTVEYVPNPCFGVNPGGNDPVSRDCQNLHAYYLATTGQRIYHQQYMVIASSSDAWRWA